MNLIALLMMVAAVTPSATQDDNVEWSGISHLTSYDRAPKCPLGGETFAVQIRTFNNDLSGMTVWTDDGSGLVSAGGVRIGTRGPYDIWEAQVPATGNNALTYYFELIDGTDSDYYGKAGMSDNVPVGNEFGIDYTNLTHAPYGATVHPGGGTVFRVWAPGATTAHVRGEFNAWGLGDPMTRVGEDFIRFVPTADANEQYKYFFNPGNNWRTASRSRSINSGDNNNSRIIDPATYPWGDAGFRTPPFEEMVIYELHVGSFVGRNDGGSSPPKYREVVDLHIDHLVALGVNVVELLPVTEFPWDFSAGYNPISAWSPEWIWGSPDDLRYLIDQLHQNGIAVLIDIVWNHFSGSDNFLWQYDGTQHYFDDPVVDTPWGAQADFDSPQVRDYYVESAHYWFEEFHIDGFRMDATDFMNMDGSPQSGAGWTLMRRFNDELDNRWIDKISIAEQLPDDSFVTRPTSAGGAGFDSQWHDRFTDDVRAAIFSSAFGDPSMAGVRSVILGSGTNLEFTKAVNYIETHDEAWPSSGGQRLVRTIDTSVPHDDFFAQSRTKLGHALVMFSPGIPMFLMGCEFLEDSPFGAAAPGVPEDERLDWTHATTYSAYLQFFQDMIALRRTISSLRSDSPVRVSHINESGNVLGIHRWTSDGDDLIIVASFNNSDFTDYQVGFPSGGTWNEILNSQADVYGGSGLGNGGSVTTTAGPLDGFDQSGFVTVPASSVIVFQKAEPGPNPGPAVPTASPRGLLVMAVAMTAGAVVMSRRRLVRGVVGA